MFFKSATFFQFTQDFQINEQDLAQKLSENAFSPCSTHEAASAGWMPIFGQEDGELFYAAQGNVLLRLGMQEKILPASVVKEQFEERVAELEAKGRRLRKQDKEEIKEEVQAFLIPRAFAKTTQINAYIDTRHKLLVVDSTSSKQVELILEQLRNTLDSLPIALPKSDDPSHIMTNWVVSNDYPETLTLHDNCTLQADSGQNTATIKCNGYDLLSDNIKAFISEGGRVTSLSASYKDQMAFTLTEDLAIKGIKFLDIIKSANDDITAETQAEKIGADFMIMSESISELADELLTVFAAEQYQVSVALTRSEPVTQESDGIVLTKAEPSDESHTENRDQSSDEALFESDLDEEANNIREPEHV